MFATRWNAEDGRLASPWRAPRQMLQQQSYDGHASIHDEAMAAKLGFRGAPIEGPTHFTQFEPLGFQLFGEEWLRAGRISSHYRSPVFEGEKVRAFAQLREATHIADITMEKEDGTEVLRGTISVGALAPTALEERLRTLKPAENLDILADVKVGMKRAPVRARMGFEQNMGDLYPFSLREKLEKATESSAFWRGDNPWGRAVIPFEMISVLAAHIGRIDPFPTRGKAVGLFADQEIQLIDGPLFVDEDYDIEREVVALSSSKRTESLWVRSTLRRAGDGRAAAVMLLNAASLRGSATAI